MHVPGAAARSTKSRGVRSTGCPLPDSSISMRAARSRLGGQLLVSTTTGPGPSRNQSGAWKPRSAGRGTFHPDSADKAHLHLPSGVSRFNQTVAAKSHASKDNLNCSPAQELEASITQACSLYGTVVRVVAHSARAHVGVRSFALVDMSSTEEAECLATAFKRTRVGLSVLILLPLLLPAP